ncbi:acyl carrier protein [Actinomadura oligospora]|uniref:acyl carrier protein n=1 Tax=Actinomadura oligospora TaxID=111804 RepID=UPI0004BAA48D|nr:acyl carrier protein [Actinomadura oligospora]
MTEPTTDTFATPGDPGPPGPPSADRLRTWLAARVAYYLERAVDEIDHEAPLTSYGLDSVYAFSICGDIEDAFHLAVDPTLVWDHDSVAALAAHLAGVAAAATDSATDLGTNSH